MLGRVVCGVLWTPPPLSLTHEMSWPQFLYSDTGFISLIPTQGTHLCSREKFEVAAEVVINHQQGEKFHLGLTQCLLSLSQQFWAPSGSEYWVSQ